MDAPFRTSWQKSAWEIIEHHVFEHPGTDTLFNQYVTEDPAYDRPAASRIRRSNLRSYSASFKRRPEVLLLAEAPGPRGCRFSGVPITSEEQLLDPEFPIDGRQSSLGTPNREYSAGIFWKNLLGHADRFFVWNTVPFHPHKTGMPMSIRTPTASEIAEFEPVVRALFDILRSRTVVAIGRKAERSLASCGIESTYVRHPSQGGALHFAEGMAAVFSQPGA